MTELERLTEALAEWKDPDARPLRNVDGMVAILNAATAYRDLLANGQRVEWCELHNTIGASYGCRFGREDDCRMIPKLLSVYPKEAENE